MPILLSNAFNPGDMDPGKTYPRAQIVSFVWSSSKAMVGGVYEPIETLCVNVEYGDIQDGVWVKGDASLTKQFICAGEDYAALIQGTVVSGDHNVAYAAVKRLIYQWLIDNGHIAGTIE